jgi:hypothetical protein
LPLNDQIAVTQPVSTGSADGNSADGSDLDSIAPTPRQIDVIEITDTNRTELENRYTHMNNVNDIEPNNHTDGDAFFKINLSLIFKHQFCF